MDEELAFVRHVWGWVNNNPGSKRKLELSIRDEDSCLLSMPYVEAMLPPGLSADEVQCYYFVAGLVASSPNCEKGDMGNHIRGLAEASGSSHVTNTALGLVNRAKSLDPVSARHCIRALVRQVGGYGVAVNHAELLRDLLWWKRRNPLKKWMSSFFRTSRSRGK
jgi:hypothetical protein